VDSDVRSRRTQDRRSKPRVLVVTPSLRGGSWVSLRQLMEETWGTTAYTVVGLGLGGRLPRHIAGVLALPYLSYEVVGGRIAGHSILSALYETPLLALATLVTLAVRPRVIIGNGIVATAGCLLAAKLVGARIVLSYHGTVEGYVTPRFGRLSKRLLNSVDLFLANSQGSAEDLSRVSDPRKILVVMHWVEDFFFDPPPRLEARQRLGVDGGFVLGFVGRIDREKHSDVLLEAARRMQDPEARFLFAGRGELEREVEEAARQDSRIRWLGYVEDRSRIRDLYAACDLVWTHAEETYLARPAVEALACGTPIVLPDVPAVTERARAGVRIRREMIPPGVSFLVRPDAEVLSALLARLSADPGELARLRPLCREYALKHHSRAAVVPAVLEAYGRVVSGARSESPPRGGPDG